MNRNAFVQVFLVVLSILLPILLLAQPASGRDPDSVPIDGGLSLLVAVGIGYGAKKIKEKREIDESSNKQL